LESAQGLQVLLLLAISSAFCHLFGNFKLIWPQSEYLLHASFLLKCLFRIKVLTEPVLSHEGLFADIFKSFRQILQIGDTDGQSFFKSSSFNLWILALCFKAFQLRKAVLARLNIISHLFAPKLKFLYLLLCFRYFLSNVNDCAIGLSFLSANWRHPAIQKLAFSSKLDDQSMIIFYFSLSNLAAPIAKISLPWFF
jgi:hypothetical protein